MKFYKMYALSNDFVVVDYNDAMKYVDRNFKISSLAEGLADRRYGIGCDQVIFYKHEDKKNSVYFYNADGSEAEMCGNGLRAIGRLFNKLYGENDFFVSLKEREVHVKIDGSDISVNMGKADFSEKMLACSHEDAVLSIKKQFASSFPQIRLGQDEGVSEFYEFDDCSCENGECSCHHEEHCEGSCCECGDSHDASIDFEDVFNKGIHFVSFGNPHTVLVSDQFDDFVPDQIFEEMGPKLERLKCFKNRSNIGFANIANGDIYLRVWERGTGDTKACGSGACAAAAVVYEADLLDRKSEVIVHQDGGDLSLKIKDNDEIIMAGEASLVFVGEFYV